MRMISYPAWSMWVLGFVLCWPCMGQGEEASNPFLEWRYLFNQVQSFPLNSEKDMSGLNGYVDQRLRIGVEQEVAEKLLFTGELEVFNGQVAGDLDRVGAAVRPDARQHLLGWDLKNWDLRQCWLRWDLEWLQVRAGQMTSHWGLGLLSHDGRTETGRFGFPDTGDLAERLLLVGKPFSYLAPDSWLADVTTELGGGLVYLDEYGVMRNGDVGGEIIFKAFTQGELDQSSKWFAGLYINGRIQNDHNGSFYRAGALDLFGSWDSGPSGPTASAELVLLAGNTDREVQTDRLEGLRLFQGGAVVRAGWRFEPWQILPELEAGYASGDGNSRDGKLTAFALDPSFRVGLVLFDTVLRQISAMDAQESSDPHHLSVPIYGINQLPTAGRIRGAAYLFPTVRAKPIEPLTLMAGVLLAWTTAPFVQTYQTFKNGGVPTNPYGRIEPKQDLGLEIDIGADWDQDLWCGIHLLGGVQAGWFFPGSAFDRTDGTRPGIIARVQGRVALAW